MTKPPLDWRVPQPTHYAVQDWVKHEQIKHAVARGLPTLTGVEEARPEPIACVGYGPSLTETWEKLRGFEYVMASSGATRFLIEKGIVPQWHLAVDPLPGHTVRLIGEPHPDVEYLIASACHPDVFDHLLSHGAKVTLWHIFDGTEDGASVIPRGTFSITGGCDVGLRTLTVSSFLGFRDLHVFGVDGSYSTDGQRHAGAHPVPLPNAFTCDFGGVTYKTTPGMLKAAQETCHELDMLGDRITTTFYGDGLTQAMVRARTPEAKPGAGYVAVEKPALISAAYRDLNAQLHQTNLAYGVGGGRYAPIAMKLSEALKTTSLLDYGSGRGYLAKALPFPIWEYDPAIPGKDAIPRPADIVMCTDTLEHVEPDKLMWVLDDLRRVTRKVAYFVIDTKPSTKSLADGRNAHLILEDRRWWELRLRPFFTIGKVIESGRHVHFIVGPRPAKAKA